MRPRRGGVVFTANGGTDDVSVLDVKRALAGAKGAQVARLLVGTNNPAVQSRPFGVAF